MNDLGEQASEFFTTTGEWVWGKATENLGVTVIVVGLLVVLLLAAKGKLPWSKS